MSCQECQVQRMSQNWTFPQSVPEQEESHLESQPCLTPQDDDNTHIDENGIRQPNPPPRVNMLKVVNHIEANRGRFNEGKHLKFPIVSHPRGPYNHHIVVRVDTSADVNYMNENTFNELFLKYNFLYAPTRYRISETQLQTFQYYDSSIPTWSSGVKST